MSDQVAELLADAGMSDDAVLRSLLFAVRSEATSVRPLPSAAVSALMPGHRGRKARGTGAGRRRIVTGLIVLGSLGIGAGAAAASPEVRSATQQFAQAVIGALGSGQAPSDPHPVPPRQAGVPQPSSTPAPTHSTRTHHSGSSNGNADGSHLRGPGVPTGFPGKGSPSAHPTPSPSDGGRSHRP